MATKRQVFAFETPPSEFYPIPRFLRIGRIEAPQRWQRTEHTHEQNEWLLINRGSLRVWIDGEEMVTRAGDFYFVQPGQSHREISIREPLDFYAVSFELLDLRGRPVRFLPEAVAPRRQIVHGLRKILAPFFEQIFQEVWDRRPGCEQIVEAILLQMTWHLKRALGVELPGPTRDGRSRRHADLVEQARQYMKMNPARTPSLAELARVCCASPDRLRHVFKEVTGMAPLQYALNLRMEKARQLLADESLCIYEVALQLGFEDPYYFSRLFKKVTGMAPSEYRGQL